MTPPEQENNNQAQPATSEAASTATRSPSPQPLGLQTDLYYFQQRCSICFDAQLDFCLERCRDQFCRACFSRYVSECVKSSWGMALTKIKCPVCSDVLSRYEWAKYVPAETVSTYDRNNQPYKTLTRGCPKCGHEAKAATNFSGSRDSREELFLQVQDMLGECVGREENAEFLHEYTNMFHSHLDGNDVTGYVPVNTIYHFVMARLNQIPSLVTPARRGHAKRRRVTSYTSTSSVASSHSGSLSPSSPSVATASPQSPRYNLDFPALRSAAQIASPARISAILLSLEDRPEEWRALQFDHISKFPKVSCDQCRTRFCFQCGESTWHDGQTCLEWMKQAVGHFDRRSSLDTISNYTTAITANQDRPSIRTQLQSGNTDMLPQQPTSDDIANMKWKLENSKACPRCCILINRDDGCNKVDCTMCGLRFCWICRSPWSEKCGFYRCQTEAVVPGVNDVSKPVNATAATVPRMTAQAASDAPELGVPDVTRIEARLSSTQRA